VLSKVGYRPLTKLETTASKFFVARGSAARRRNQNTRPTRAMPYATRVLSTGSQEPRLQSIAVDDVTVAEAAKRAYNHEEARKKLVFPALANSEACVPLYKQREDPCAQPGSVALWGGDSGGMRQ